MLANIPDKLHSFAKAREAKAAWIKEAKEDYAFTVGDQWDQNTKDKLLKRGILPLTLNKIQAMIFLISGIQRQNRSDIKAYPEGNEDSLTAEIITLLLKNSMKQCDGEAKVSEMFEDGLITGEGWLQPFVDYTWDLLHGKMRLTKKCPLFIFQDPAAKEYDLSDAEFIVAYQPDLSLDQVLTVFPSEEKKIKEINNTKLNFDEFGKSDVQYKDNYGASSYFEADLSHRMYDITLYHYYKYKDVFIVIDPNNKDEYKQQYNQKSIADDRASLLNEQYGEDLCKVIKRKLPVPYVTSFVGDTEIADEPSPFYPKYKKIPLFGFFAHTIYAPLEKREFLTQGIVRSLKDPQREINKRKTNELHILNTSSNSGWLSRKRGGFVSKSEVKEWGSSPGVILEYENEKPEQIFPKPLSSGHEKLVELAYQDIKEISGINTEMLSMQDTASTSGRAIHLRQQQGLMMLQRMLDNFRRTKADVAKFLISQLGEMYDVETARRVVGDSFIKAHFSKPILDEQGQPQLDQSGNMATELDEEAIEKVFTYVLHDDSVMTYDVAVGEIASAETIKLANYSMLMDLMQRGMPIPPDIIIEESMIADASKEKIKKAIAAAQQNMASQRIQPQGE